MNIGQVKKLNISKGPGCYQYFDSTGKLLYVGKAANLHSRVLSYFRKNAGPSASLRTGLSPAKHSMMKQVAKIKIIETDSEIEALLLESNLIKKHQPPYNIVMRDDKRYQYIKITDDEYPRVVTTREIGRTGRYFGPFTSGTAVVETMKAIRKIFPYGGFITMPVGKTNNLKVKRYPELYEAPEDKSEYLRVIKQIESFLEGNARQIFKDLQLQITNYELKIKEIKNKNKSIILNKTKQNKKETTSLCHSDDSPPCHSDDRREEESKTPKNRSFSASWRIQDDNIKNIEDKIKQLKYRMLNMKNVLAHSNVLSIHDKYVADVVELAKILGLTRVPKRIEGYDISNIFGKVATGSMVVFKNGEPDKGEYKKFIIKNSPLSRGVPGGRPVLSEVERGVFSRTERGVSSLGDTQMLKEVLIRRFSDKHIKGKEAWPLPDLIIIDGGKGQLNAGLSILKRVKFNIPIIAISKGEGLRSAKAPDKIFFPGEKEPLKLPLASPALHIIKRVRDEAHRFAIAFHRKRRNKSSLK